MNWLTSEVEDRTNPIHNTLTGPPGKFRAQTVHQTGQKIFSLNLAQDFRVRMKEMKGEETFCGEIFQIAGHSQQSAHSSIFSSSEEDRK